MFYIKYFITTLRDCEKISKKSQKYPQPSSFFGLIEWYNMSSRFLDNLKYRRRHHHGVHEPVYVYDYDQDYDYGNISGGQGGAEGG